MFLGDIERVHWEQMEDYYDGNDNDDDVKGKVLQSKHCLLKWKENGKTKRIAIRS